MVSPENQNSIMLLWVTDNKDAALNMIMMYAGNSKVKGWWDNIIINIWGPSQVLVTQDEDIQARVKELLDAGVNVIGCRRCAEVYGITDELQELGIDIFFTGNYMSDWIKEGKPVLSI